MGNQMRRRKSEDFKDDLDLDYDQTIVTSSFLQQPPDRRKS